MSPPQVKTVKTLSNNGGIYEFPIDFDECKLCALVEHFRTEIDKLENKLSWECHTRRHKLR